MHLAVLREYPFAISRRGYLHIQPHNDTQQEISDAYFKFGMITGVTIGVTEKMKAPSLSACFRWVDVIEPFKNKRFENIHPDEDDAVRDLMNVTSMAEIFEKAPLSAGALFDCRIRKPGSYEIFNPGMEECNKLFNTSKFYMIEYICYRFQYVASKEEFTYDELANTPTWSSVFYELGLHSNFSLYKHAKFIAHNDVEYPFRELSMSTVADRSVFDTWNGIFKTFKVFYFTLKQRRLPPPYPTKCRKYDDEDHLDGNSQIECQQICMNNETITAFGKSPFSSILYETAPQKPLHPNIPLTYRDMQHPEVSNAVLKMSINCARKCNRQDCEETLSFTRLDDEPTTDRVKIRVYIPTEALFSIRFLPMMDFVQYFTNFLSTLGVWFGTSVIDLEPLEIYFGLKDKYSKKKRKGRKRKGLFAPRNQKMMRNQEEDEDDEETVEKVFAARSKRAVAPATPSYKYRRNAIDRGRSPNPVAPRTEATFGEMDRNMRRIKFQNTIRAKLMEMERKLLTIFEEQNMILYGHSMTKKER